MWYITLYQADFIRAKDLIFDSAGNFWPDIYVNAIIREPAFVIAFQSAETAQAFAELLKLHGKITKFF